MTVAKKSTKPKQVTSEKKDKGDGKFGAATIRELAGRAGWICSNPRCQSLTIGAADEGSDLATKVGEGAHIKGEKDGAARWEDNPDDDRGHIDNGIWLCPRCHTLIDKNDGGHFTVHLLHEWKRVHEKMIVNLMLSPRSPLAHLRSHTQDGKLAQEVVDKLSGKGSMFVEMAYEAPPYVEGAITQLRDYLEESAGKVTHDELLKARLQDLYDRFRKYMNDTSAHPTWRPDELRTLRRHVGIFLQMMEEEHQCKVRGDIRRVMPDNSNS